MAIKNLNTRIKLKYDSYENWSSESVANKGANLVLLKGEIGVAYVPNNVDPIHNAPTVLFKVGDGTTPFKTLNWASGLAADVYSWAKAATKPTYTASEVGAATKKDITDAIAAIPAGTDTQYQLVWTSSTRTLKLQSKDKSSSTWTDVSGQSFTIPDNNTTYTFAEGTTNGAFSVTPSGSSAQSVKVHGLGTAAYKADTYFATAESVSTIESSLEGAVEAGIADLDATVSGMAAGKTLKTLTQTDGKIAATFQDIAITQSQVSGLSTALNDKQNTLAFEGTYNASTNKVATKSYVDSEIAKIDQFKYVVSTSAATTPAGVVWYNGSTKVTGTLAASADTEYIIYLVPCKHSAAQTQEGYDEYLTVKNGSAYSWEVLGNTRDIDLTGYVPTSRKINDKALTGDITLGASDVGVTETAFPGLNKVGTVTAFKMNNSTKSDMNGTIDLGTVVTSIKMNGTSKTVAAGAVDLGTVITAHQDISGKQDKLSTTQLAAVNSGITAAKVTTYDGYASKISTLEGKPGLDKVGTVTSVSTTANNGLKVTNGTTAAVVDIDDSITFVLDCGSATVNV